MISLLFKDVLKVQPLKVNSIYNYGITRKECRHMLGAYWGSGRLSGGVYV